MKFAHYSFSPSLVLGLLIVLVAGLFSTQARAQSDAFSIEVAVAGRSVAEERDAYAAGLRRILLNNSGDKTILNRDLIRQGLRQAEDYVKAFSYRRPSLGTIIASDTPITSTVQKSGEATQLMLVSFDRTLVNQLISDSTPANAGRSGEPEPVADKIINSALVWMTIQDEGRGILISDSAAANVRQRAREIAGAAGISLVYPTGDEEDQQLLVGNEPIPMMPGDANSTEPSSSLTDTASRLPASENIADIADRYAQDTVLIGYLSRTGPSGWTSQWTRVTAGQQQQADFQTSSLDLALQQGLGILGATSNLDTTYRYGGNASSDVEGLVWVGSLDSTEDYARMMSFFGRIDTIGTVYAKEVQPSSMVFSIVPRSALNDIESAMFDVSWLQRSAPPLPNDANSLLPDVDLAIQYAR